MFYDESADALCKELDHILIEKDRKVSIFTPNVDHIITLESDTSVKQVYMNTEILTADGWPVVMVSKLKKNKVPKITGVDLMDGLLKISEVRRLSVFFLGGTECTLEHMAQNIGHDFKNIRKIGYHNGYFDENENNSIIELINSYMPDILFVGMGHPKQEKWVYENKDRLNASVILAVGGAFRIFSKEIKRAPLIVQKLGMEWFWRFIKEPKRLFYRYFVKYPKFIGIALRELWG
jgi:N-acetylglucosaminyldiphosphoundecaprenol N-acetyl-beta-D-mannosaminyltransferase